MFEIPGSGTIIRGGYEWGLVFLSYGIAVFASYTALDLAQRIEEESATARKALWLSACSLVMGCGIWAMHFTAMQAFKIPIPVGYSFQPTLWSLLIAIIASGYGLFYSGARPASPMKMLIGGSIMGCGIAAMHYVGMAAMIIPGTIHYRPVLFGLSVGVGIFAATAGLWLINNSARQTMALAGLYKTVSPLVMGLAIVGMHYTGMAGTDFVVHESALSGKTDSGSPLLSFGTAGVTLLISSVAVFASITQGRYHKLRLVRDELDVMVRERTRELTDTIARLNDEIEKRREAQLRMESARQEAEKASNAKSEFLARMSHELRTPLNAIIGFAQLLEMYTTAKLDERELANLRHILAGGQHLLLLVNEVLELNQIESGRLEILPQHFAVEPVIREVAELLEPLALAKRIRMEISSASGVSLFADADRFKQILINLVSNAVKYNHDGGLITIETEKQGNARAAIRVRDSGIGISAEHQKELFKPFTRFIDDPDAIEGTGIGLTITRRLVELMAGSISVESNPGQGSCFTIVLPEGECRETPTQEDETMTAASENILDEKKYVIVYVEDNVVNFKLVEEILCHHQDLLLLHARDGISGIEMIRQHRPHLVLLDIYLPGMNGLEVFEELKRDESTAGIPVIALTASARKADMTKVLQAGFSAYLTKPLDIPEFIETLDRFLER